MASDTTEAPDPTMTGSHAANTNPPEPPKRDESPEARYRRRFPQPIRIGDLVGRPVVDDDDVKIGEVTEVVRTPEGRIRLIVGYSRWFGLFAKPVAVPLEVVCSIGRNVASVDMQPVEYVNAPTWTAGRDSRLGDDERIRIALAKR